MKFVITLMLALLGSAAAFAPQPTRFGRPSIAVYSRFEGKVWDINAKMEVFK